jgi:HEAT repeat protein
MRAVRRARIVLLLATLSGCAPPACSDEEDTVMLRDVELVAGEEGRLSRDAADRLAQAGGRAVALVETGLYAIDPAGRRRLVKVLARTGSPEARPVLEHLAARDPDPEVRAQASAGLRELGAPPAP